MLTDENTGTLNNGFLIPGFRDAANLPLLALTAHFENAAILDSIAGTNSETDNLTHLDLAAGQTSLRDRVSNLIDSGNPLTAVNLVDAAFAIADNETIDDIIGTAQFAYSTLQNAGYKEEADFLGHTLTAWSIPPKQEPAALEENFFFNDNNNPASGKALSLNYAMPGMSR